MRILLLTSAFVPTAGGAETYALNLALGVGSQGHSVRVVTNSVVGMPSFQELTPSVAVSRLEAFQQRLVAPDRILWEELQFCLCPEVEAVVHEFQPDLVFSNNLGLCALAKIVSLSNRIPWAATFHEQAPERESFGDARLRFAYGVLKPDIIIAGSQFYHARALRYGNPQKTHLVYHGIDLRQFSRLPTSPIVRRRYKIPGHYAVLISAGRLKPRKGHVELIHAMGLLRSRGFKVFLIIAGSISSASAEYREQLKALVAKLDLSSNVALDETVSHRDMATLLSAADIVVQPSLEEGLGLAVIEAMACGNAVVTTRIPGILEIVTRDDVATLIEPGSPDAIATAVESLLLDDDKRTTMGNKAREHVMKHFSLESMSASTIALLGALTHQG